MLIRILLPSIIFAFTHNFNFLYIFMTFFMGIILNYMFIAYKHNDKKNAFILVVIIHMLYNSLAILI